MQKCAIFAFWGNKGRREWMNRHDIDQKRNNIGLLRGDAVLRVGMLCCGWRCCVEAWAWSLDWCFHGGGMKGGVKSGIERNPNLTDPNPNQPQPNQPQPNRS